MFTRSCILVDSSARLTLIAVFSSADAAVPCTTPESCSIPWPICSSDSACELAFSIVFFVISAKDSISSIIRLKASAVVLVIALPLSISIKVLSINSLVLTADLALSDASFPIWSATTAKPFPASPALAASMEALRDKRFVWEAISSISVMILPDFFRNFCNMFHFLQQIIHFFFFFMCPVSRSFYTI